MRQAQSPILMKYSTANCTAMKFQGRGREETLPANFMESMQQQHRKLYP